MSLIDVVAQRRKGEREQLDLLGGIRTRIGSRANLCLDVLIQPERQLVGLQSSELVCLRPTGRSEVFRAHVGARRVVVANRGL